MTTLLIAIVIGLSVVWYALIGSRIKKLAAEYRRSDKEIEEISIKLSSNENAAIIFWPCYLSLFAFAYFILAVAFPFIKLLKLLERLSCKIAQRKLKKLTQQSEQYVIAGNDAYRGKPKTIEL